MTAASWYASAEEEPPLLSEAWSGVAASQKEASSVNLDSRQRLSPGTRVGDHLVVRGVLGEGGTAVVYEALHTRLGASVALKVVDVSEEYMEGAHARLRREAHVCASLEDPHVPRVYDVGELPDGTPYVVMERVSGRTLEDVLTKEGALSLDVAVHIADDLLLAVEAIEKAGIVHRDIKPPNIILQTSSEGVLRVRLMDFGVSKSMNVDREPGLAPDPSLTQQGAIVGTPHYMAPEQIVGPNVDSRADLYAVGVVAYEMMGGRTPFEGQTTGDVVAAVLHTRPLALRKLRDVHPELEAWVERAMAPRRPDRFVNAREMRDALHDAWDAQLAYATLSGRRTWVRTARVAGGLGLLGVALALPLPAGYDLNALAALMSSRPSVAPVQAANAEAVTATVTNAIETTAPAANAAAVPMPVWDLGAGQQEANRPAATRAEGASRPVAPAPMQAQSEPPRHQVGAAAAVAVHPTLVPGAKRGPAMFAAPIARTPAGSAPRAPIARTPAASAPVPVAEESEPAPRPGVLLDEYVRQLEEHLRSSPPAVDIVEEPKRNPGQIAPNPFDSAPLPDNPYQGQVEEPQAP